MVQKMLMILLVAGMVSGFSWGRTDEDNSSNETKATSTYARQTSTQTSGVSAKSNYNTSSYGNSAARTSSSKRATDVAPADEEFPTDLLKSLASGDESVRRARIDSLRRLSEAMSKMKTRNEAAR